MSESSISIELLDEILSEIGSRGWLEVTLQDQEWDLLYQTLPPVSLSAEFSRRALEAMARAQQDRENRSPAVELGMMIAQSRNEASRGVSEIAVQIGVPVKALETLERGRLSFRQFLNNFPPGITARLLVALKLNLDEFSDKLMEWFAFSGAALNTPSTPFVYRRDRSSSEVHAEEVVEYISTLEHLLRLE